MIKEDDKSLNLTPTHFVLLKKSVEKQKWPEVLLLISNPDLEIPDEYWPNLAKFKNKIISSENLKADFVSDEYLRWSLKSSTHLGKLSEFKSQWLTGLFKEAGKTEATVLIEQELISRNESKRDGRSIEKNRELIRQMAFLVEIDQTSRDAIAQRDAVRFRTELNQWMSENKDDINHPLFSLMEVFIPLMDKGIPALLGKKNKYEGELIPTKIYLNSPKIKKDRHNGYYAGKHGVHIKDFGSLLLTKQNSYKLMSVIFHELMHHLIKVIYNHHIPNPRSEWKELAGLIQNDLGNYGKKVGKIPDNYQVFNFSEHYSGSHAVAELPSRIVEFMISNRSFNHNVFSSQTIKKINNLFGRLCIDIANYKSTLVQMQKNSESIGRIQFYQMMLKGQVEEFTKVVNVQDQRRYNLFPMHSTSMPVLQRFEDHKFPLDSKNKFGVTVLEKSFAEHDFERMLHIFEKIRQSDQELGYALKAKIDLQDEQGQTVLMYAIIHEYPAELIDWLVTVNQANVELTDRLGMTAWDYANSLENIDFRIPALVETDAQKEESIMRQNRELLSAYESALDGSSSDSSLSPTP